MNLDIYQITTDEIDELKDVIMDMSSIFDNKDLNLVMVSLNTVAVSTIMSHIPEGYQRYAAQTFMNSFMAAMAAAGVMLHEKGDLLN